MFLQFKALCKRLQKKGKPDDDDSNNSEKNESEENKS